MSGADRCKMCKHYILEFSHLYKTYVEGCDLGGQKNSVRRDGCKGAYEPKSKPKAKAYIKRRIDCE